MHLQGWKFHGGGFKVNKDLVNDINYILIYYGFRMILELQAKILARLFVNGIITFGVIISNPIVRTIMFKNCTTPCAMCKVPISLTIEWAIPNVWMKHLENFHEMLTNNALCCKGGFTLPPF